MQQTKAKIKDFKHWFMQYGDELLEGWLRAKADGSHEAFKDWLLGEYDYYREHVKGYEVPYHGLCDSPSRVEAMLAE